MIETYLSFFWEIKFDFSPEKTSNLSRLMILCRTNKQTTFVLSDISTSLGVNLRQLNSNLGSSCALLITHLSNLKFNERNLIFTSGQSELKYQLFLSMLPGPIPFIVFAMSF